MAENDVYNSERTYNTFKNSVHLFLIPPEQRQDGWQKKGRYYCKNKSNLEHFKILFKIFEAKDLSYVRRIRLLMTVKLVCFATEKDLRTLDRSDVDGVVRVMHESYKSPKSKSDFIKDLKYIWKLLFPERDERGRIDDKLIPYAVRHLSDKIDRSRQKMRRDRLEPEEIKALLDFFASDYRMKAWLSVALETLARPQELAYIRLKDVLVADNYVKLSVAEHGKEGVKELYAIDSRIYLVRWLEHHPMKNNKESFLFVNTDFDQRSFGKQFAPANINKLLRKACMKIGLDKQITAYSIKRSGVTQARLKGFSDVEIQKIAGWSSTRQLATYDLSNSQDVLKIQLARKGLIVESGKAQELVKFENRICIMCSHTNPYNTEICEHCTRPLDRTAIVEEAKNKDRQFQELQTRLDTLERQQEQANKLFKVIDKLLDRPEIQEAVLAEYRKE